ncbi:MAG: D-2-hydroxyacid dehydrogenase family protein [Alphaproteobacteria bacterium]
MKLAILDDYQGVALKLADWSVLPDDVEITVFDRHLGGPDQVVAALADFELVCLMRERTIMSANVIAKLPKLKLLVTTGMRNASVDDEAAVQQGVTFCGTGGRGNGTAELTWGLILALARHIPAEHAAMREGGWQTTIGTALEDKTLGLLGLGKLGSAVAKVGAAFGMNMIAWSQNLTDEKAAEQGVRRVDKAALLSDSDILSIHVVLSERSRGLIGAPELAAMKDTALLVNTSRGPIVDQGALVEALQGGQIAGAGLDVYDVEPLPADHPLRKAPNVVLTPHLGYVTDLTYDAFYGQTVDTVKNFLAGTPVRVIAAP